VTSLKINSGTESFGRGEFWDGLASSSVRNFSITAANLAFHSSTSASSSVIRSLCRWREAAALSRFRFRRCSLLQLDASSFDMGMSGSYFLWCLLTPLVVTGLAGAASSCSFLITAITRGRGGAVLGGLSVITASSSVNSFLIESSEEIFRFFGG